MRAEPHLVVIHGKVHNAAAELEELLAGVTVALVLLDRVLDGLLGQAVLQLEGGDRQTVDEETEVEGTLGLVAAVAELPGDAEAVGLVERLWLLVARRGRAVEEVEMVRAVLQALAQHVDGAALGDLTLQASEELAPVGLSWSRSRGSATFGCVVAQEGPKLNEVHAVLAVVVTWVAADPTSAVSGRPLTHLTGRIGTLITGRAGQRCANQPFKTTSRWCRSSHFSLLMGGFEVVGRVCLYLARESASSSASGSSASSGNCAAASRTSSLPVTTSAIRRVRYSRRRSISFSVRAIAASSPDVCLAHLIENCPLFGNRGKKNWKSPQRGAVRGCKIGCLFCRQLEIRPSMLAKS